MQKCKSRKIPVVYTCHLGLTEVIAPIKEDNVVICYFMFGQIIIDEFKDQTMFQIYDKVKDMSFKNDIIKTAIDNIHCVTGARLSAAVKILETILTYIFSTKTISATRGQFVKRLDAFIDSHLTENVLIHDLQEYFNFSRTHLYEVSKSYLDCSLGEYILNRKISHAQNLLEKTKARIMEVSEQVGFSDYNYFSRVFRKKMGISPREYRNKNLPEAQE
jgi:AraC-like DNA-binding protein